MTMTLLTLVNPDNLTKQNINCMREGVNCFLLPVPSFRTVLDACTNQFYQGRKQC